MSRDADSNNQKQMLCSLGKLSAATDAESTFISITETCTNEGLRQLWHRGDIDGSKPVLALADESGSNASIQDVSYSAAGNQLAMKAPIAWVSLRCCTRRDGCAKKALACMRPKSCVKYILRAVMYTRKRAWDSADESVDSNRFLTYLIH